MAMKNVVVVGTGNGAHVCVAVLGARPDVRVHVLAPHPSNLRETFEARVRAAGGVALFDRAADRDAAASGEAHNAEPKLRGAPASVTESAVAVVPDADVVLLVVPAFAHGALVSLVAPLLRKDAVLCALPAQGGLEWASFSLMKESEGILAGLNTLPWATRLRDFGESVDVFGTKQEVQLAAMPRSAAPRAAALLQDLLGVRVRPLSMGMLGLTLSAGNAVVHPPIMYSLFRRWSVGTILDEAPLVYCDMSDATARVVEGCERERVAIVAELERRFPDVVRADALVSLHDLIRVSYSHGIADDSSVAQCFRTNRFYHDLRVPSVERQLEGGASGVAPDFASRYLSEDLPYGLVVMKDIAELADVDTPWMNRVIAWGMERLWEQNLLGDHRSRTPAHYGFASLDDIVRQFA